jgi:D-galactose 1-dehydrogenase
MARKINLAIVGLGHVALYQIAALKSCEEIYLLAACDINKEKAKFLSKDVLFFNSLEELLSCEKIDVVLISTPTREHFSMGMEVMEAGKGLLLEKPATENYTDFKTLITYSKNKNIPMAIALHAAFGMDVKWFYNFAQNRKNEFGSVSSFNARFSDPYILNGKLIPGAEGLINPWLDSGINSLSVVGLFIDPKRLKIKDSDNISFHKSRNKIVKKNVKFSFRTGGVEQGGVILTDWASNVNQKTTELFYKKREISILLDHSAQMVWGIDKSGKNLLYQCQNRRERLLNHYINMFTDFAKKFNKGEDNLDFAEKIHSLLYEANTVLV